jgi:hypothetical protein
VSPPQTLIPKPLASRALPVVLREHVEQRGEPRRAKRSRAAGVAARSDGRPLHHPGARVAASNDVCTRRGPRGKLDATPVTTGAQRPSRYVKSADPFRGSETVRHTS